VSARYLVDTNVLSAGSPSKLAAPRSLLQWMDIHSRQLYLSTVTVTEVEEGVAKAQRQGSVKKTGLLRDWLETVIHLYAARILPFDLQVARQAGRLSDDARGHGHTVGFEDLALAATSACHRMTILTRNLKHYAPLGVAVIDPFASLPDA